MGTFKTKHREKMLRSKGDGCDLRDACAECDLPECVFIDRDVQFYDIAMEVMKLLERESAARVGVKVGLGFHQVGRMQRLAVAKGWV